MITDSWTPPSADRRHAATWTTGAKDGVGTSADAGSRIWFTISRGVLTEIFYPGVDCANTRDVRFVITGEDGWFADEWSDADTSIEMVEPGTPAYRVRKDFHGGACSLEKTIVTDPDRPTVLQRVRLMHSGRRSGLRILVLVAPHVGNRGDHNDAWTDEYKGGPMIFARRRDTALALASSVPLLATDCAYAGDDDAWHDLRRNGRLTLARPHAMDGNLLVAAELGLAGSANEAVIAIGFGADHHAAAAHARASLSRAFDDALERYVGGWARVQAEARPLEDIEPDPSEATINEYRTSVAVLRVHEDKTFPGALIASLASPWGEARGDFDEGGYHLVWPRDAVESAGGLLAAGLKESAGRALLHLMSTQEAAGNWPQNMWLNGRAYWHGVQLDEAALPVLLADLLRRDEALGGLDPWPMIRQAVSYVVINGPATPQDRWEIAGGYSPFTLAVEIAALLVAARFADDRRELQLAQYLRETADYWSDSIDIWTYCRRDTLSEELGIDGYYARRAPLAPDGRLGYAAQQRTHPRFARHTAPPSAEDAGHTTASPSVLGVDALALVRFGLRRPDDPRILNTVRAIDHRLKSDTKTGPIWHRFDRDTYGETENGDAPSNEGIGRGWPLLTGERAHYELARGEMHRARALRSAMMAQTGACGMIPEQIWDAPDIPGRRLCNGRPTKSAMPLSWAHAEFIKLCRSLGDGAVFDMPPQTVQRYIESSHVSPIVVWRDNARISTVPCGKRLRVETSRPATVSYSVSGSDEHGECMTVDTGIGVHFADVPTERLTRGSAVHIRSTVEHGPALEFTVCIAD